MGKAYLDSEGLRYVWDKIKGYLAKKQDKLFGKAGQVVGFDERGKAVALNGSNIAEQAYDLALNAASQAYVDGKFNLIAPVLVSVEALGDHNAIVYSGHVKAYPADSVIPSYSINVTLDNRRNGGANRVVITPPQNYAFTGVYHSSGLSMEMSGVNNKTSGFLSENGDSISFPVPADFDGELYITGSFILEVA